MDKKPQPEPMPLIEESLLRQFLIATLIYHGVTISTDRMINALIEAITNWLPAHDQQVRKDFAEECIKGMHILRNPYNPRIGNDHVRFDNTCAKQLKACLAHLRAMAGGER